MTAALVVALMLFAGHSADQPHDRATLVAEGGANFSFRSGLLEIKAGHGWLRIPRLYLDFKSVTRESDAGVVIRTLTGTTEWPEKGYRLQLPTNTASEASSRFRGRRRAVTLTQEGRLALRPSDEWQTVDIVGRGREITISLNGTLLGVFEIGTYGGHILFENSKGVVQFRNMTIASIDPDWRVPDGTMKSNELTKAGGHDPILVHEVKPFYTAEAMHKRLEGRVQMEAVVLADGSVGSVRITRSLDADLDLSAIAALREWKFTPAVLNGKNVPLVVDVEMTFTLK